MNLVHLLALFAFVGHVALCHSGSGSASGSGSDMAVCDPMKYMQTPVPPIPTLPNQFSTILEAGFSESNTTQVFIEHFDYPGNRGRLESTIDGTEQAIAIFDYDMGEAFLIPDLERDVPCGVQLLNRPSEFANSSDFGISYVNGSVHIGTVANFFGLTDSESALYLGTETVRGIPCNHWQTCHVFDTASYTLDYYFASTSEWNFAFPGEIIPVKVELNGSSVNEDGTQDELHSIYSLIAFHSGPSAVPDEVFQVPTGLPCLGRVPGKELPMAPQFFSLQLEYPDNDQGQGATTRVREFYDSDLFRLDVYYNDTPYTIIHDFNLSVGYSIDRRRSICDVYSLETVADIFFDIIRGPNDTFQLKSPTDLFRMGTGYNFSYEGETTVRGIPADAWISLRDSLPLSDNVTLENGTVELFYSRPGWTSATLFSMTSDPVPLASSVTGTMVNGSCDDESCRSPYSAVYNIFDFSSEEPDFDIFDTSFCSTPDQYLILSLIIPGHEYGSDLGQLRRSVRFGLTEWAAIPALQVANIKIAGENGTYIFVTLQILTLPDIARYDNPRTPMDIFEAIMNGTSSDDELPFTIDLPSGQSVRPFLLRVDPNCPVPSTTTTTATTTATTSVTTTATTSVTTTATTSVTTTATTSVTTTATTTIITNPTASPTGNTTNPTGNTTTNPTASPTGNTTNPTGNTTTNPTVNPTGTTTNPAVSSTGAATNPTTGSTTATGVPTNPPNDTSTNPTNDTSTNPTASATTAATSPEPRVSDCPTVSSVGSSGISSGTVAGIAIAMFIVGMICALALICLLRIYCSRRKSFNLTSGDYRRQENEMEGFTD